MKKTVTINGQSIEVNSLDVVEEKGEALDFGFVEIPFSTQSTNYQILSPIKITIEDGTNTKVYDEMIIISDKVERISRTSDTYSHTIGFIESISQYEKILSASIAITQPLTGPKLTLKNVLDKIRDKVPFERTSIHASTRLFTTNTELGNFLNTIEAPQFFFNNLSLRDMLNQLASYVNGIARLRDDGELIFDFYNEFLSLIGINNDILNYQLTADFQNFGTTSETNVENAVVGDDIDKDFVWYPELDNFISMRSSNLKLEDDNYEFRILDIEEIGQTRIKIRVRVGGIANNYQYVTVDDVSNFILEKSKWDRLDVDAPSGQLRETNYYKSNTLYYEYGGNTISNPRMFGIFSTKRAIDAMIEKIVYDHNLTAIPANLWYLGDGNVGQEGTAILEEVNETVLQVKMIPYGSYKIRQQKSNANDVGTNTQILNNQKGRLISSKRLGANIKGYTERTGNDEIVLKRSHIDLSELWNIGDYFRDNGTFVLVTRKLEYNQYDILAEYTFTKNFNRLSQFIQLDQEDRQYEIPINKQIVDRKEIYEEYIEMDVEPKTNTSLLTPYGVETFINTFRSVRGTKDDYPNKPISNAVIYSDEMDDPQIGVNDGIFKKPIIHGEGTSLSFGWYFNDPQKAGDQLLLDDLIFSNDIQYNEYVRYTDINGELNNIKFGFYNSLGLLAEPVENNRFPVVDLPSNALIGGFGGILEANDSMKFIKDRSETIGMNYNLNVIPNYQYVDNFIIGKYAIENNNLIKSLDDLQLYVWTSDTEQYFTSTDNELAKGVIGTTNYQLVKIGTTYDDYTYKIEITDNSINGKKSWGLADVNGNLYLGVNQNGGITNTTGDIIEVYFNPLNIRTNIRKRFDNNPIVVSTAPEAPINLIRTDAFKTSATFTWIDNSIGSDNFFYQLRDENLSIIDSGIVNINTPTKQLTGLTAGTNYLFEVKTVRSGLSSAYTELAFTTEPPIPIAPTGGNITNISDTSFTMNWTDNAEYEDGFRIYISDISSSGPFDYYGSVGKNATSGGISGLTASTPYWVRVFAYNTSEGVLQESTTFASANATTTTPPPPKSATPTITVVAVDDDSISFRIKNNDASDATMKHELNDSSPDTVYGILASGVTSNTITYNNLARNNPGNTYTIYATAQASGESVSNPASFSQKLDDAEPLAPSTCSVGATASGLEVSWSDVALEDGYTLEIHLNSSFTSLAVSRNKSANSTYHLEEPLLPSTSYWVRIRAYNNVGFSAWKEATGNPIVL